MDSNGVFFLCPRKDWFGVKQQQNKTQVGAERVCHECAYYRKTSNISRTLADNKIVDNSDVVGASPVGAAPTTSSFST